MRLRPALLLFSILALITMATLSGSATAGAADPAWTRVTSPTDRTLHGIDWWSSGYVAVGNGGTIVLCDALGLWTTAVSGTGEHLRAVDGVGSSAWAVGDGGTILRTTDGGASWQAQASGTTLDLAAVDFLTASDGWTVGGQAGAPVVLHTSDGGANWVPQTSVTESGLTAIAMIDSSHGVAAGGDDGVIWQTSDGGALWDQTWYWGATDENYWQLNGATAFGGRAWLVGTYVAHKDWQTTHDSVFRSTDGGLRWRTQWSTPSVGLSCVTAGTADHLWAVGRYRRGGSVARTPDGGERWKLQTLGIKGLEAAAFVDAQRGYAVGDRGAIYRTVNGWLDKTRPGTRAPYPATVRRFTTATLRYRVSDVDSPLCKVTIRVRNAAGTVVKTLRLGYVRTGSLHAARFRCTLPAGTYRFRVTALDAAHNGQLRTGANRLTVTE